MNGIRSRTEHGASAVEFALVVPILAMLLVGVISVALTYNSKLALANAVREGARTGATLPAASGWGGSVQQQIADALADPGDPAATDVKVCAKLYKVGVALPLQQLVTAGCGSEPSAPSNATGCYVKVWASRPGSMDWLLGRAGFTIKSASVAIYDRNLSCNPPAP